MKITYYDSERLVIELHSVGLIAYWIVFIFFTLLWLGIGGGIIAQTRSIRCEKIEPTVVNCEITDSLFWGAIRRIKKVENVRRVFVDEEIGYSDASQYPIYRVFLVVNEFQEVPFTDWLESSDYTNQIKNSLETFLRSQTTTYALTINNYRNFWGAIVFVGLTALGLLSLIFNPYQVRFILNKVGQEILLIKNFFLLGVRKRIFTLDQIHLRVKEDTDSDNDTYYAVVLTVPDIDNQTYLLKVSSKRQEIEDYWQFDPDIRLLREFIHSEDNLPQR